MFNSSFRTFTLLVTLAAAGACTARTVETVSGGEVVPVAGRVSMDARLASWPEKQRETASMLMSKYGQPDISSDRMLVWHNRGPFVRTVLHRDAVPHHFPMPHQDYLTQTVMHKVPADKVKDLFEYDGSVWAHRTRGELSAQCDLEVFNLLALNLAHDIIMNRRTVADARAMYARTAMAYKNGDHSSPYTSGLMFSTEPGAADPDHAHKM